MGEKVVTINKQARFRYQFLEKFEAGIVLQGSEVKSVRANQVQLSDAYAIVKGWKGVYDDAGELIPCTRDNIIRVLTGAPWLLDDLLIESTRMVNFQQVQVDSDAKI